MLAVSEKAHPLREDCKESWIVLQLRRGECSARSATVVHDAGIDHLAEDLELQLWLHNSDISFSMGDARNVVILQMEMQKRREPEQL